MMTASCYRRLHQSRSLKPAAGRLSFDALVRTYIREHLAYRVFVFKHRSTQAQIEARRIERAIQRGETALPVPVLNPLRLCSWAVYRILRQASRCDRIR